MPVNRSEQCGLGRADIVTLMVAMVFPSLLTWLYFVALKGDPATVQQTVYTIGKTMQFALPAFWVFVVHRRATAWKRPGRAGLAEGLLFGAVAAAVILGGYYAWLRPAGWLAASGAAIGEKVLGFGVDSPAKFALLALFYSAVHSFLEEYYWRWFVFGELRRALPFPSAVAVSSLAFMAHHVIVLGSYFGWTSAATVLFSAAVAVAGGVWCWIYQRSGTLASPWLSHVLADAAIFAVGYDLARGVIGA